MSTITTTTTNNLLHLVDVNAPKIRSMIWKEMRTLGWSPRNQTGSGTYRKIYHQAVEHILSYLYPTNLSAADVINFLNQVAVQQMLQAQQDIREGKRLGKPNGRKPKSGTDVMEPAPAPRVVETAVAVVPAPATVSNLVKTFKVEPIRKGPRIHETPLWKVMVNILKGVSDDFQAEIEFNRAEDAKEAQSMMRQLSHFLRWKRRANRRFAYRSALKDKTLFVYRGG